MALQVFRRRRLWRAQQQAGPDAGPLKDAWDASGPDGFPELPRWAAPGMDRAREILAEMEENPPF